jgi:hypothetical protein
VNLVGGFHSRSKGTRRPVRKVQLDPRDIASAVPAHPGAAEREVTRADQVEDEITTWIKTGAHASEDSALTA